MSPHNRKYISEIFCDLLLLKIDKSTDINKKWQFLSYAGFVRNNSTIEQSISFTEFLYIKVSVKIINRLEKNMLQSFVCKDGVSAITGKFNRLTSRLACKICKCVQHIVLCIVKL